ncbi:MAG: hypothetical protein AAGB22_14960, partial [Bacteroidota bacterium]
PVWMSYGDQKPYCVDQEEHEHEVDPSLSGISVEETNHVRIFHESRFLKFADLIDMPGISDPNMAADVWQRVIHHADIVVWCSHATQAWRQSEAAVWSTMPTSFHEKSLLLLTRMDRILSEKGISDAEFEQIISKATADGGVNYNQALVDEVLPPEQVPHKNKALVDNTSWMFDGGVSDEATFKSQMEEKKQYIRDGILGQFGFAYSAPKDLKYHLTKAASVGLVQENAGIFALISFFLTCVGGLIYLLPKVNDGPPGIKNNRVFFDNALNRGWIGITLGTFLIGFYILLYKFPEYITNWVLMLDSVSLATNGNPADQWFMYGFMYCLAMGVMGTRMIIKYRHNKYQIIRTGSILFFQFAIAFSLP